MFATGAPDGSNLPEHFVSIANGETLVMQFTDNRLIDGVGNDLKIWEIGGGTAQVVHLFGADSSGIFYSIGTLSVNGGSQEFELSTFFASNPLTSISQLQFHSHVTGGGATGLDLDAIQALNSVIVPEPTTLALLALGIVGIGARRRQKN